MAKILLSGAYLIRNKQTDTVIEIGDSNKVVTAVENPNGRREQQIWWVEALPGPEHETEKGQIYSITNISRNVAMEGIGMLAAYKPHGLSHQKWWITRVQDEKDSEFYNIISLRDGDAIDIQGDHPGTGARCLTSKFSPESRKQRWEFVCPAVAIPPGWVQIRSVSPGRPLIQQMYFTSPPFFATVTPKSTLSNDRANWGTQWIFLHGNQEGDSTKRYWCIRNRLTGGFLAHCYHWWHRNDQELNVYAGKTSQGSDRDEIMWRLDIHQDGYWTLFNKSSNSFLIASESSSDATTKILLATKENPAGNSHKKWEILEFNKMKHESMGE